MKLFNIFGFFGLFLAFTACGSGSGPSSLVRQPTLEWIEPTALMEFASRDVQASSSLNSLEFIWNTGRMDTRPIQRFSTMSENEIIETIRGDHELKVLIIPGPKDRLHNDSLTISNLKRDEVLARYYAEDPDDQIVVSSEKGKEKALAQYLPMYSHRHGTNHEILSRPGQNYPMIILTNNSTKLEIIHEYMHHYLTCREGEQAFSVDGIDHSLGCKVILNRIALNKERDQVREQLIKKEKELENFGLVTTFAQLKKYADLEKEMLKLAKQSWSLTGKLVLNEVEIVMQFPAEELDIHRYTYQHSDDLHLDPSEQKWDLYAMADYFNEIFDDLYKDQQGNFTYSFMNAVSLFKGTGLYTDDNKELRSLYDQISVALREVDQKMLKTFLWLEPRKPPQS